MAALRVAVCAICALTFLEPYDPERETGGMPGLGSAAHYVEGVGEVISKARGYRGGRTLARAHGPIAFMGRDCPGETR